jgi:hypothetical protein
MSSLPLTFEAIRENENSDKIGRRQCAADFFAAGARASRQECRLARYAQLGALEVNCRGRDLVVGDVLVVNLPAGATAQNMSVGEHRAKFAIALAARQRSLIVSMVLQTSFRRAREPLRIILSESKRSPRDLT